MTHSDVTVVIPNYNRTTLLRRALQSVAGQTHQPQEVLIVDDCSSAEKLIEIQNTVADFSTKLNVRLLINAQNRGANYSRNRGIFEASSKYVAFLDSDDLWMPQKLQQQLIEIENAKKNDSRPVLSSTGRYRVDGLGRIIARQFGGKVLTPGKIRESNFIGTLSAVVVETWIARHIHGFNETLPACQDWDFFIRLSDYVQYVGVSDPLCIYVDHDEERITHSNKKRLRAHIYIYRNHIKSSEASLGISKCQFYRNIAEDYQELGNRKRAAQFFAKSVSMTGSRKGRLVDAIWASLWETFYRWRGPPSIKQQRYVRYRRVMAKAMKAPVLRSEVEVDSRLLNEVMGVPVIAIGRPE